MARLVVVDVVAVVALDGSLAELIGGPGGLQVAAMMFAQCGMRFQLNSSIRYNLHDCEGPPSSALIRHIRYRDQQDPWPTQLKTNQQWPENSSFWD
ncbi:hypothetical protein GCM10022212_32220 [Actimicrobium antarcticum]|uniref:Uncharacterized protein n=1 Tax=Actimicrobium antarcticum TaxID=1051899 RepID=A0ABP7TUJ5_9BURK